MNWIEIPSAYLVKGKIQQLRLFGRSFCLVYDEGHYVAFSAKCPHAGAPLAQGWIADGKVVCAYHRQRFDLCTGEGEVGQGNYITIFPTKVIDGKWYVGFRPTFWQRLLGRQ